MATYFDSVESSSGYPKNIQCIKLYSAFWDPKTLTMGSTVDTVVHVSEI
jgi:hypothetical protein